MNKKIVKPKSMGTFTIFFQLLRLICQAHMPGSYGTVPTDFSDILRKSFANSVARYTSRSYHFHVQKGSDLSGRTSYFQILNEICYYENVSSHYLYSRHKKK